MVNNPLYPGYSPKKKDEESINPIYPGYYTGKPLPKVPQSKEYLKPIEYNVDEIMEEIDNAGRKVLLAPLAGPRWVKERIVDDWKSQLKVSIIPEGIKVTDLDDYATEDLPGAMISLSLNPKDWGVSSKGMDFEQTRKQTVSTIKNWVKETTGINAGNLLKSDFSDIENKAIHQLWTHALGYGDQGKISATEKIGGEAVAERTSAMFSEFRDKKNPLNLKGVDEFETTRDGKTEFHEDLYKKTANAAADFVMQRDSAKFRDSSHSNFLKEAVVAANIEIQGAYTKTGKSRSPMAKHKGAIDFFNTRVKTMEDIYKLQSGIKTARQGLEKTITGTSTDPNSLSKIMGNLDNAVTSAKNNRDARVTTIDNLFKRGEISQSSYDNFKNSISEYDSYIGKLAENSSKLRAGDITTNSAIKFLSGNTPGKSLTKGSALRNSVVDDIQKSLEFSLLSKDKDQIGSLLNDNDLASSGIDLKAKILAPVAYRMRRDRTAFATKELLTAWDEEKLLERYAWSAVQKVLPERLAAFTSGQWIGNALEKRNYFGLKVAEKGMPTNPKRLARFEKKYGYKVSIDVDTSILGVGKILVKGGDQFKILENESLKLFSLDDLLKSAKKKIYDEKLFKQLLNIDNLSSTGAVTLKNLMAKRFFGKDVSSLSVEELKSLTGLMEQGKAYNDWLKKTFSGKKLTTDQKYELFKTMKNKNNDLNPGYTLTKKYAGSLEKFHNKILTLQKKWEGTMIGKSIKFISNWKTILSEKAAALISKLVAKALGIAAAATGFLAIVMPILEKAAEFLIKKTLTYAEAFVKALIKWDFDKLGKMFKKDMEKVIKSCLVVTTIVLLPILMVTLIFFGVINTTISEIDPTRGGGDGGGDVCAVAAAYDVDCCILEAILMIESGGSSGGNETCGSFDCCYDYGFLVCGPAGIKCGQYGLFAGEDDLDMCDPAGAAELLIRAIKLKLCYADGGCQSGSWATDGYKASGYTVSLDDLTGAAYFYGTQGCFATGCTQYRWGEGKTYCDSITAYCETGSILPQAPYSKEFCDECNVEFGGTLTCP